VGKIFVAIVTYNSADCIDACLASLKKASRQHSLVTLVVDNHSTDNTLEFLSRYPDVKQLHAPENLGYAGGNNLALEHLRKECSWTDEPVLILNPDVVLEENCVDLLAACLLSGERVGGVSPVTLVAGDPNAVTPTRSLWGWPFKKRFAGMPNVSSVDRLHGACMLLRRSLIDDVGSLNTDYFLYWEELDFCRRARRRGWTLLLRTDVKLKHRYDRPERAHTVYYMYRNLFLFASRAFNSPLRWIFVAWRLMGVNAREILSFLRSGRQDLIRAAWLGLKAGWRGEKGRSRQPVART
jgi:N-acetylglucosaminyl-diphospho-decaprenol L-rhamnosyltransferase